MTTDELLNKAINVSCSYQLEIPTVAILVIACISVALVVMAAAMSYDMYKSWERVE